MTQPELFDSQPDPELGHLLRQHYEPADPEAFVAQVRAAVAGEPRVSSVDVLARWGRRGVAAAAIAAAALGLLVGRALQEEPSGPTLAEAVGAADGPAELIASGPAAAAVATVGWSAE